MKKIGIITYPQIEAGKGRFLQAYALYSAVIEMGYEAEIINYQPEMFYRKRSSGYFLRRILHDPKLLCQYLAKAKRKRFEVQKAKLLGGSPESYKTFIDKNMHYDTGAIVSEDALFEIGSKYDALICGSDQIWNPRYFGMSEVYYLHFVKDEKKIAYAASIGTLQLQQNEMDFLAEHIRKIKHPSVREVSAQKFLRNTYGINVDAVCDPTFLMPRAWWNSLSKNFGSNEYILVFLFDDNEEPRKFAKRLASLYGLRIVTIVERKKDLKSKGEKVVDANPPEFIGDFRNAKYVITQSFHGTVLSLIYNKEFFVFGRQCDKEDLMLRIEDLLDIYNLKNRMMTTHKEDIAKKIDYTAVNKIMEAQRKNGLSFLKKALFEATDNTCKTKKRQEC